MSFIEVYPPVLPGAGLVLNADGITLDINPADSTVDVSNGLKVGTITDSNVAVANKDGAAGTPSLRTLGSGVQQAAPGSMDFLVAQVFS